MKKKIALLTHLVLIAGIMLLAGPGLVTHAQGLSVPWSAGLTAYPTGGTKSTR